VVLEAADVEVLALRSGKPGGLQPIGRSTEDPILPDVRRRAGERTSP
jgi:hypothetical protein